VGCALLLFSQPVFPLLKLLQLVIAPGNQLVELGRCEAAVGCVGYCCCCCVAGVQDGQQELPASLVGRLAIKEATCGATRQQQQQQQQHKQHLRTCRYVQVTKHCEQGKAVAGLSRHLVVVGCGVRIGCSTSTPVMLLSANFRFCSATSRMCSSIVLDASRRSTSTSRDWPMRCARAWACRAR
jgi:hypothetical protein